jgi:hypothetical protein
MTAFCIRGHAGFYAGGLSELCHKCVTHIWKSLMEFKLFFPSVPSSNHAAGKCSAVSLNNAWL